MSPRTRAGASGSVPERRDVYERLADELRQAIVSGKYKPGDRLPEHPGTDGPHRGGEPDRARRLPDADRGRPGRVGQQARVLRPAPERDDLAHEPRLAARAAREPSVLDGWAADVAAAGLAHREEISVAIEDSSAPVLGTSVGERLGLAEGSRVLVRHAIRYSGPAGDGLPGEADSLADEYYPYELVRDSVLASPGAASSAEVLPPWATGSAGQ